MTAGDEARAAERSPGDLSQGGVSHGDVSFGDIARVFLRLGLTAFGGPAAHIALMEAEIVRRRAWISPEKFLDLLGAANLIPGPSSTELAIFIGYEKRGVRGLVVAGASFILPAALMVLALAWAYVRFGSLPHVAGVLYGVKPVVIAVLLQALVGLAPKAVKKSLLRGAIGACACGAALLRVDALALLVAAGLGSLVAHEIAARKKGARPNAIAWLDSVGAKGSAAATGALATGAVAAAPFTTLGLFLVFLKIGAVVFGSGYVLLAFLRADLVDRLHWLSEKQLLDAVAVGQVTPGPVFTTATFIGYVVDGPRGAVVATVAIFLPGFVLVALTRPLVARVRKSPAASAFFDGVNVGSLGLMAAVSVDLGRAAFVDAWTAIIGVLGAALLLRLKINATWLLAGAAILGVAVKW